MDMDTHVIVGAGITGLTVAVELQKYGKSAIILESSEQTGGISRSFRMDGVVFDVGPHMLMLNPHRKCGVYLRNLLHGEKLYRRRYMFAVHDGIRHWQSPVTPMELLRYPPWARSDVFKCLLRRIKLRSTIPALEDYIGRRSGRKLYSTVFEPLVRKKLGTTGSALHENWWLRPSKNIYIRNDMNPPPSDRRTMQAVLGKFFHDLLPMYYYPERGIGTVADLLRKQFTGRLITSCGGIKVHHSDERITEVSFGGNRLSTSSLVWTAPVREFYESIGEASPVKTDTVSTRIVFITFRTDTLPKRPYLYTYHNGIETVFNRVYYPRSIYGKDSPGGVEGFCFEIRLTDKIREMSFHHLIDVVVSDARRAGIAFGTVIQTRVIDVEYASPVFSIDYLEKEKRLFSAVGRFGNLLFAGRQGNYCNCLIPGAVEQGMLTAERIIESEASL